jgi:hypothetical protein
MTDPLLTIATELAAALRPYPCTRVANYAGDKPTPPCRHCEALARWDAYRSIVQVPSPQTADKGAEA